VTNEKQSAHRRRLRERSSIGKRRLVGRPLPKNDLDGFAHGGRFLRSALVFFPQKFLKRRLGGRWHIGGREVVNRPRL
jgi:hypothetical protein